MQKAFSASSNYGHFPEKWTSSVPWSTDWWSAAAAVAGCSSGRFFFLYTGTYSPDCSLWFGLLAMGTALVAPTRCSNIKKWSGLKTLNNCSVIWTATRVNTTWLPFQFPFWTSPLYHVMSCHALVSGLLGGGDGEGQMKKSRVCAEGFMHILPDPLVTHVSALCLCVGGSCWDSNRMNSFY